MKSFTLIALLISVISALAQDCEPLSASRFRINVNQYQVATSDDDLSAKLEPTLKTNCLETYQVVRIASMFRNDGPRLMFTKRAYGRVTDPENYYDVFDTFLGFSSAFKLYDFINYKESLVVEMPLLEEVDEIEEPEAIKLDPVCSLSDKDYNSLIATLKKEPFPMRRLPIAESLIRDRCLNVKQIAGFMDLLTIGKDRVSIAKSAFDNCTEPLEYHRLIEKLSFSSDKDDLLNFIKSR